MTKLAPEQEVELTEIAAAMLRGELICVKGHRADKSEHIHFDDVHRWGQRIARVLGEVRDAKGQDQP